MLDNILFPTILSIVQPAIALTYPLSVVSEPVMATSLEKSAIPLLNKRPIRMTSVGKTVQTTSPLFTGLTLFICTPTFPAGCGPSTSITSTFFATTEEPFRTPRYTLPTVSFASASNPV